MKKKSLTFLISLIIILNSDNVSLHANASENQNVNNTLVTELRNKDSIKDISMPNINRLVDNASILDYQLSLEQLMNNDSYDLETLKKIVELTPPSEDINNFRNKYNSRRNGHKKLSTKYFDVYYKDNQVSQEYAEEIAKNADTAYMFLAKLYKKQIPVEIYLIKEEEAHNLEEGEIRRQELATFVYINDDHTKYKGDMIHELIHEMNHNFFSVINDKWTGKVDKYGNFVDEGISRIIGTIYFGINSKMPEGYYRQGNKIWEEPSAHYIKYLMERMKKEDYYPTINELADYMNKGVSFANEKQIIKLDTTIFFWWDIYQTYGIKPIQQVVRTIGNSNYKEKLETIFNKSLDQLEKEFYNKGTIRE